MTLTPRDLERLQGVHPDLVRIVRRAADLGPVAFMIVEGVRSIDRQRQLVAHGASQTMKSRHIHGFAVDLGVMIDGELRWDWPLYSRLAAMVKTAATLEGVPLEWGGDWKTLKDGPHFQLPAAHYPDPAS